MPSLYNVVTDYFRLNHKIRTENTREQYRFALSDFRACLRRDPVLSDLNDDAISGLISFLIVRKLSPKTINERVGRLVALWTWLARRSVIARYPNVPRIPEPIRIPTAWTRSQLDQLVASLHHVRGRIAGIPAAYWWKALHLIAWDTGERIGAMMQLEWCHLENNWLTVPAELRKGKRIDMIYRLKLPTVEAIREIKKPERRLILPWPHHPKYLWVRYRTIRRMAGLPTDRKSSFHRIRKSVATYCKVAGGDPTEILGHSDRRVTEAYIDPRIYQSPQATDYLFDIVKQEPPRAAGPDNP